MTKADKFLSFYFDSGAEVFIKVFSTSCTKVFSISLNPDEGRWDKSFSWDKSFCLVNKFFDAVYHFLTYFSTRAIRVLSKKILTPIKYDKVKNQGFFITFLTHFCPKIAVLSEFCPNFVRSAD